MKPTILACIGFLLSICLFAGCGKPIKKMSYEEVQQARLDWNIKTLTTAYQNTGSTDPAWDKPAAQALTEFARTRAQANDLDEPVANIIATNCDAAIKAGCHDPLVRYLYIKYALSQTNTPKFFSDSMDAVASDMQQSQYPDIRKFYASLRAYQQFMYTYGYNNNTVNYNTAGQMLDDAAASLTAALNDKTMPPEEGYEAGLELIKVVPGDADMFQKYYGEIEKPLFANWPNESTSWLLKGQAYHLMASIYRGNGDAGSVSKDGWKKYTENLAIEEKALNHAWELNPTDARIAVAMIYLELAQPRGRDRMEKWFNRAMEDQPDDYDACSAKLLYLEPQDYGSVEDMLDFGRECVTNANWSGTVPLILVDAHYGIYNEYIDASDRTYYWAKPDVWADISSAYEKYLQSYPNDTSRIAYYARYAYSAGQWEKLNELLPRLPETSDTYYVFGGKGPFNHVVELAHEHASGQ